MIKLLKEIFKSLSKNKITVISLSILIFLTTAVFSLLFSVKESFSREVNRYNQVSKMHDNTVDLDINFSGSAKDNGYEKSNELHYSPENNGTFEETFLKFNTNFIKLEDLGVKNLDKDFYIKANDLKLEYDINKNIKNIMDKDFDFQLQNGEFRVLNDQSKLFLKYRKNSNGEFIQVEQLISQSKEISFILDRKYQLKEVIGIEQPGRKGGLFDFGVAGTINSINQMAINLNTNEATFDVAKINAWENLNVLYLLTTEQTANLLGIKKDNNKWFLPGKREFNSQLFNWDDIAEWASPTLGNNVVFKSEGLMNNTSGKAMLKNDFRFTLPSYFRFSKNDTYKLKNEWIEYVKYEKWYILHNFKLQDLDPTKRNFSPSFLSYLMTMKNDNPQEFAKIENLSYWEKQTITKNINDEIVNTTNQKLDKSDLLTSIILKKNISFKNNNVYNTNIIDSQKPTTIKDIENLGNELNIKEMTESELNKLSNYDIVNSTYANLKNQVYETIKETIYNKIKENELVEKTTVSNDLKSSLGRRRFLTTSAIDEKTKENRIYQFIDAGISNEFFDKNQEQNVGKLFQESQSKSNLYPKADPSLDKFNFNAIYSSKIINGIFQGYIPNREYLDVNIQYINIKTPNTLFLEVKNEEKVIILKEKNKQIENSKIFAVGNSEGIYQIYQKNNNEWEKHSSLLTLNDVQDFINNKNLTLDAKVGANGWFKVDENYINSYSLPFIYRAPSSSLLKEIETQQTVKNLFDSLTKAISNSDLVTKKFVRQTDLNKLFKAMERAFSTTKYYEVFINGKNDQSLMQKMIFESLYFATIENGDLFINDFIINFIEGIKLQLNQKTNLEQKQLYFAQELNNIGILLSNFGIDFWNQLLKDNSIEEISKVILNPENFLDGISNIVRSINFKQFLTDIHNWYELKWNKKELSSTEAYYYFGIADLVIPLIKSIDFQVFKKGISEVIENINFDSLLSTTYDKQGLKYKGIIFNKLINSYKESIYKEKINEILTTIFNKINGNKDLSNPENNFKNVKDGLISIVSILDKDALLKTIENSLINVYFESNKIVDNNNSSKVLFVTKGLKNTDLVAAFINTFFKDAQTKNSFLNSVEKMFNLSGKTGQQGGFFGISHALPEKDEHKLDLFDLQNLEILSFAKLEQLIYDNDKLIEKIDKNKENATFTIQPFFDENEKQFIKKYLFKNGEIVNDLNLILEKANVLKKSIELFKFNRFKFSEDKSSFQENDAKGEYSISDNLYKLYLEETNGNLAYKIAKPEAKKAVNEVVHTSELSGPINSFVFYKFWVKFIVENNHLTEQELNVAFNSLVNLAKDEKYRLFEKLNDTNWEGNFQPSRIAQSYDIQPIGKGIVDPFSVANDIFFNTENIVENDLLVKLLKSPIFKKESKNKNNLSKWIIENRVELISVLAQVANFQKQDSKSGYFSYLESGFKSINKFVNSGNYNGEIIDNLIKDFTVQSSIFLSLGLSDVVTSTYSGAIFPVVSAWYTANPDNGATEENNANLVWVLKNRITDFSKINNINEIKDRFYNLLKDEIFNYKLENHDVKGLSIDLSYVRHLEENIFQNNSQDIKIFDININRIFYDLIDASTVVREENKFLVFKDVRSLVAKVSQSFMEKNDKEAYTLDLPKTYDEMEKLLDNVDEKHIINVNGSKFLIVGHDSTVDYLFPVIDEENLQVDTKTQAPVYVNKWGFDRVRESFRGNTVKDYLLVKLQDSNQKHQFNEEVNNYISTNFSGTAVKKSFAIDEFDFINPERSLRISTTFSLIDSISKANFYMITLLSILVTISTLFITKRYISTRNKVIGILRAQGYSSVMIAFSFISFPFITSFIGGVLGYITGLLLQLPLKQMFANYWTLPTNNLTFEWQPFLLTTLFPFAILSVLVIGSAMWILRTKPIELMSGIVEINVGNVAQFVSKGFRKTGIKTKFAASLTINSFWKLISLMISTILTAFISLFSIASMGVFKQSVDATYRNRNYRYKLDLETPTIQGGAYKSFNKNELDDLLYVPIGDSTESNLESNNYFKPGRSLVNGSLKNNSYFKNGNPSNNDPHVLTRAALQLQIESSLAISPWDIVLNSMPDSQRARTLKISQETIYKLEKTQNINNDQFEYVGTKENPLNYFKYIEDSQLSSGGKFWYMVWDKQKNTYEKYPITTLSQAPKFDQNNNIESYYSIRDEYRKFLVEAYKKIDSNDFFMGFGGIIFNENTNEKYSYIQSGFNNESNLKIYGYNNNSKFVSIKDKNGTNLIDLMEKYVPENIDNKQNKINNSEISIAYDQITNYIYPISVNYVFLAKHNLKLNDVIEMEVKNSVDRYFKKLENKPNDKIKFRIVGIIDTYINSELATTKDIANLITGLSFLDGSDAFNGILSNDELPEQTVASIGLYAKSGYWFGSDTINPETTSQYEEYFTQIYSTNESQPGVLKQTGFTDEQINKLLFMNSGSQQNNDLKIDLTNTDTIEFKTNNKDLIPQAVDNFINLYSKNIYDSLSTSVDAKDIEIGFVNNVSKTVSDLTIVVLVVLFIVSIVILVMISTMIIAENEKNIAVFSILGYNNKEKIKLFFGIYLPLIIIATLIAIPLAIGFIALFNAFLVSSSSIVLALSLKWWHILTGFATIVAVFVFTSIMAWINMNKIKAIDLLKGK
ncbi:ABC transporter permease [Mesomycoplasma lagogenitalium]|uniref:ABC transporter permease n=1 Tax=Mesomycoplasma lagogenitalium TaxID=171286 RepID=A0ABY8LVC2_9BACT|nr:ABC transporter permease [Mesomycoplasma lagogenitalium]WGI36720.1 ABC transporter permease [Mesomycoplasma lagogenitalium]